ncbi:hypothetical protein PC129_g19680 [Phytophthora cactorum]|uniref:RxLR effector protein n=1 Tax=Phytophthora cactorum TaxID=29920 RepID=A0A329RE90_9STRA|nr:hypothetical protein Pcac1_g6084 [Phytophthora cactorum]KAG2799819.1 hypothetical protein PC111_g20257 [Phytophthora cactorum]KAG2801460.1 hypothetical protein PC112_g20033 [Phytophthora cactorum]KAG2835680.1 hypothetical protein PC113_g20173 [Phytophthora cactorum]KAG2878980.1 hypothetical protein PC114_g22813 [Phytophthora cactorum]
MRVPSVLLLAVCIVIASCDARLSAADYEQDAVAAQNAKHSVAAAEYRDTSGKRLFRSDDFAPEDDDVDDAEERGIPGLSKLNEMVQKGKTKVLDQQLWSKYRSMLKSGFSDKAITEAWIHQGKTSAKIYDRWIRLGKSQNQAAKNLLREGIEPEELFKVLKSRGMKMQDMSNIWRNAGLDETEFYLTWAKLGGIK